MLSSAQAYRVPYWRLSIFYLFYFGALGALVPYWALYLSSSGFGAIEIGELMALFMMTKFIAPNVWGWIADMTGQRMRIVRLTSFLASLAFLGVFQVNSFVWMALVMMLFSFFWAAALPQFEAITLNHLSDNTHAYTRVRLWGSVGFILSVVGLGAVFDYWDVSILPVTVLVLFSGIWLSSLFVEDAPHPLAESALGSIVAVIRRPEVIALFLATFFQQISHGPYYTFFTLYMKAQGLSHSVIGPLWALGVLAEIGIFLAMFRLLPRFGSRRLILFALLATCIRWLLIAQFPTELGVVLFAQILHAASYGIVHAAAIHLIHGFFTGAHQVRGQALYASVSFGLGGAVGNLLSGYLWEGIGGSAMYLVAAGSSALALVIAWFGVRDRSPAAGG